MRKEALIRNEKSGVFFRAFGPRDVADLRKRLNRPARLAYKPCRTRARLAAQSHDKEDFFYG
jgi:hypothetical protein